MLAAADRGHVVDRGYCVSAQLTANEPVQVTHTLAGITPADRYMNSASGSKPRSRPPGRHDGRRDGSAYQGSSDAKWQRRHPQLHVKPVMFVDTAACLQGTVVRADERVLRVHLHCSRTIQAGDLNRRTHFDNGRRLGTAAFHPKPDLAKGLVS
jgi:hypothetical protein